MNKSNKIDTQQFVDWLNTKWKGEVHCPVCKENDWSVHDFVSELREFNQGGLAVGGSVVPLVSITCNNCAYTMYFNAIMTGLIENKSLDKKTKDGGK